MIDINRCCGFVVAEILMHELISYSRLFDEEDTTKLDTYILSKKLDRYLTEKVTF